MKKSARKFLMFILAATFILQPAWKVRAEEEALPDNTAQEGTIEEDVYKRQGCARARFREKNMRKRGVISKKESRRRRFLRQPVMTHSM